MTKKKKKDDCTHINIVKLDAMLKGVTLDLRYGHYDIKVWTNLATQIGGVKSMITAEKIKTNRFGNKK